MTSNSGNSNSLKPLILLDSCAAVQFPKKQNQKNIAMVLENNYMQNTIVSPQYHQYENETIQNIIVVLQLVIQSNTEKRIAEKILDAHFSVKKTTSKS